MKYNHAIKYKGVYYPTGTEVPVEDEKTPEELDAELKAKEEAEKLEAEKLEAEKVARQAELIKKVKAMKRSELDAYAVTVGVSIEVNDTVETLKEKIIAVVNA